MKKQKKKTDATTGTGEELILSGAHLESDTGGELVVEEYRQVLSSSSSQPVTVDLSDVRSLSALGIHILLGLHKSCKSDNRALTLTGVSDNLYDIFETFALTNDFSIRKVSA